MVADVRIGDVTEAVGELVDDRAEPGDGVEGGEPAQAGVFDDDQTSGPVDLGGGLTGSIDRVAVLVVWCQRRGEVAGDVVEAVDVVAVRRVGGGAADVDDALVGGDGQ